MRESQKLLSYGFRYFETQELYKRDVSLKEHEIFYADVETVSLGVAEDVVLTFPRGYYKEIEAKVEVPKILEAPLNKGDEVAQLVLKLGDETIYEAPVVMLEDVEEAGVFGRLADFISIFFSQLFGVED